MVQNNDQVGKTVIGLCAFLLPFLKPQFKNRPPVPEAPLAEGRSRSWWHPTVGPAVVSRGQGPARPHQEGQGHPDAPRGTGTPGCTKRDAPMSALPGRSPSPFGADLGVLGRALTKLTWSAPPRCSQDCLLFPQRAPGALTAWAEAAELFPSSPSSSAGWVQVPTRPTPPGQGCHTAATHLV